MNGEQRTSAGIRQLTNEEITKIGATSTDADVLSLVNEVVQRRKAHQGGTLEMTTIVSARSGLGMVQFRMGETVVQMSVAEANDHARNIIEAATCAKTDEMLHGFLKNKIGLGPDQVNAAMADFRSLRA